MSESSSTPTRFTSIIDVTETVNALNELHLLDSPKTTHVAKSSQSRLRAGSKGRTLFQVEPEKSEKVKWMDKEIYALVLFLMLYTDGKSWVVHKDMKFWSDAGIFVQRYSNTSHCRTGKIYVSHIKLSNLVILQVPLVGQELQRY